MLKIENLKATVDDKVILNDFNMIINDGETHVIMGPNGVGKSTLSRVIMGDSNYKILSGNIIFNGDNLIPLSTDERAKLGIFLAMQYPMEIEGVSNQDFLRTAIPRRTSPPSWRRRWRQTGTCPWRGGASGASPGPRAAGRPPWRPAGRTPAGDYPRHRAPAGPAAPPPPASPRRGRRWARPRPGRIPPVPRRRRSGHTGSSGPGRRRCSPRRW